MNAVRCAEGRADLAGQNRLRLVELGFCLSFLAISAQLGYLTLWHATARTGRSSSHSETRLPRPDIVDRNGVVLATDVAVPSLYADPRKIIDIDEAVELLTATVPDLDAKQLRAEAARSRIAPSSGSSAR